MAFHKKTIRDIPLKGKTVLLRADYNVPLAEDGSIRDDLRIRASLPTITYLRDRGAKVVIVSHLGRPNGKKDLRFSLEPVARHLANLLQTQVRFGDDCIGDRGYQSVKTAPGGSVVVLENTRFYPEEEANDTEFAKKLAWASRADYFVQDGFGVVHRAHATTDAITQFLPSVAGLLLEKEYDTLTKAVETPKRPLVAIMGGAKVSDKITVIERFVAVADQILIGGAMANTFLAHKGYEVGKSMYEKGQDTVLNSIYAAVEKKVGKESVDTFLHTPQDVAVATDEVEDQPRVCVAADSIQPNQIALDIGDATIDEYVDIITRARTVIWNGPVGFSELPSYSHGSARIALALASHPSIVSIVGGGDTADFVLKWDGHDGASFTHVSTGGGAGLELMAGKKLPGVEALLDAAR